MLDGNAGAKRLVNLLEKQTKDVLTIFLHSFNISNK